jgi:hypothetical protein
MKSAHATITLYGHEGWVRDTVSLPLQLQINIDDTLIDCQIVADQTSTVELERSFDAIVQFDWSDDWDAVDMRGRIFALQYGNQVLGQARMLSGLE